MSSSEEDDMPLASLARVLKRSVEDYESQQASFKEHSDRLLNLLSKEGMILMPGPKDGDCFVTATAAQTDSSPEEVRARLSDFLIANQTELDSFFEDGTFEKEVSLLRNQGVWNMSVCDCLPLAVANLYDRAIRIYSSSKENPVLDIRPTEEDHGKRISEDMIYYAHYAIKGVEHYDWCVPCGKIYVSDISGKTPESVNAELIASIDRGQFPEEDHTVPEVAARVEFFPANDTTDLPTTDFDQNASLDSLGLDSSVPSLSGIDTSFDPNCKPADEIQLDVNMVSKDNTGINPDEQWGIQTYENENTINNCVKDSSPEKAGIASARNNVLTYKQESQSLSLKTRPDHKHHHRMKRTVSKKSSGAIAKILARIRERKRRHKKRVKLKRNLRELSNRITKLKARDLCKEQLSITDMEDDSDKDETYEPSPKKRHIDMRGACIENNDLNTCNPLQSVSFSSARVETQIINEDEDVQLRTSSRKRDLSKWKQNERKQKRSQGIEYTTSKGKTVKQRQVRPTACKHKTPCSSRISETEQQNIHNDFWMPNISGSTYLQQRLFIHANTEQLPTQRHTVNCNSRRNNTIKYFLPLTNNEEKTQRVPVCKKFFLNTLDITQSWVYSAKTKAQNNGMMPDDVRGKHTSNKLTLSAFEHIKAHIQSFPTVGPHYSRRDSTRRYLESSLTISQMYKLYKGECNDQGRKPCSSSKYTQVFKTFNLAFHRPKKDRCSFCNKYMNSSPEEQTAMQSDYDAHIKTKDAARQAKESDKKKAQQTTSFVSFNFDKQAVLPTPKIFDKQIYYKRKLSTYNETTYDVATREGRCWVWHETEGGRGSNEVATCIYRNIKLYNAEHITMFSDTCGGENRNAQFSAMCMHCVQEFPNLETIEQKFFEPGHSEMEADSMHSAIQSKAKRVEIQTPYDWDNVIRMARSNPKPYSVERLSHDNFLNWKKYAKIRMWKNFKSDVNRNRIQWLKIRQIRYSKSHVGGFEYKYSFAEDEDFKMVHTTERRSDRRSQIKPFVESSIPYLFETEREISQAKKWICCRCVHKM